MPDPRAQAAYDAGFRGNDLLTAIAVSLAEGGNPLATNNTLYPDKPGYKPPTGKNLPEYSVGYWQINLSPDAHGNKISEADARDPFKSAKYAYELAQKNSFTPWATYNDKSYQKYFSQAASLIKELPGDATVPPITPLIHGGGAQPATSIPQVQAAVDAAGAAKDAVLQPLKPLYDFINTPHIVAKVALTGVAVALIVAGFAVYAMTTQEGQAVVKAAVA